MPQQVDLELLQGSMPGFKSFLDAEGAQWRSERARKDTFFKEYFGQDQIGQLDEGGLRELIHLLWAFNGWTNKDWLLQQMLTSGLPTIRAAFEHLLHDDAPLAERFDQIRRDVRMMGAAGVSEVLAHVDHDQYAIWNRRSRQGLIELGVDEALLPKSAQITGARYAAFCSLARDIQNQVAADYPEIKDLFELDLLLYYFSTQVTEPGRPGEAPDDGDGEEEDFDHDAVIDQVIELGDGLGFEVEKEFSVMRGCRIDAIWRSRVANLGTISYAFEVHRKGSRDSAILNLQRVCRDPTVQKVVLVSTKKELDAFRGEIASLDESFRDAVGFFPVGDLQRAVDDLGSLKDTLSTLGLLGGEHLLA